jgi:hypothetical protein
MTDPESILYGGQNFSSARLIVFPLHRHAQQCLYRSDPRRF